MPDDPEIQSTPDGPPEVVSDEPTKDDLVLTEEVPPPMEAELPSGKFGFINKQPLFVKILASLLLLSSLLWFATPKCSSPTPEKTYLIALNSNWYPLQLATKERDMTTFCKVLFNLIAAKQGLHLRIMETKLELFRLLDSNACDGVISILSPPELTSKRYISSDAIYQLGIVLVVKKDSYLTSSQNIGDSHIGIIGSAQILLQIAHLQSAIFTSYENSSRALNDLDNRNIDGVIIDTLQASTFLHGLYAGKFKILSPPLVKEGIELYLHQNKESEPFLKLFNEGLRDLRKSGTYHELIEQWGLIDTEGANSG